MRSRDQKENRGPSVVQSNTGAARGGKAAVIAAMAKKEEAKSLTPLHVYSSADLERELDKVSSRIFKNLQV